MTFCLYQGNLQLPSFCLYQGNLQLPSRTLKSEQDYRSLHLGIDSNMKSCFYPPSKFNQFFYKIPLLLIIVHLEQFYMSVITALIYTDSVIAGNLELERTCMLVSFPLLLKIYYMQFFNIHVSTILENLLEENTLYHR